MIGGLPIAQPVYPYQQYPAQAYAQPPVYPQPRSVPPTQQAAAPRPAQPAAGYPLAGRPVVRGQSPDEAPARPRLKLEMPTPEALGVPVPATPLDWTDLRVRLDRLGATGFALEQLPAGGYRFSCRVPSADPARPRLVEGRAATEAEAVRRALEQAAGGR